MKLNFLDQGSVSKNFHTMKILCAVHENPGISRSMLSKLEGISKPTTTRIVDQLLQEKWLIETGTIVNATSKRKPIGLTLNPNRFCCIGITISQNIIIAVITDFEAKPLYECHMAPINPQTPEELYKPIEELIVKVILQAGKSEEDILGVGIGLPGLINKKTGMVTNYAFQGILTDLPFQNALQTRFSFPILIDNNVNTLILSEQIFPQNEFSRNSLFINYWGGIGAAAILDGHLLAGSSNAVGEIGHTIVQPSGLKCRCGNLGCAETYCLPETICAMVSQSLNRGRKSLLGSTDLPDIQRILACWEKGDILCSEHIMATAEKLSLCFANAINTLDPDTVILSGEFFEYSESFFNLVIERTREKLLRNDAGSIRFILRHASDLNIRLGAVSLVFDAFFKRLPDDFIEFAE